MYVENHHVLEELNISITNGKYRENATDEGNGGFYITNTNIQVTTRLYIEGAVISSNNA